MGDRQFMINMDAAIGYCYAQMLLARSRIGYELKRRDAAKVAKEVPEKRLNCDTNDLGRFVQFRLLPLVGAFPYPPDELMLMAATVVSIRPEIIIEWGTNIGVSARVFLETTRRYSIRSKIHSIDLPFDAEHFEHPKWRRGILVRGRDVTLHEGDGLTTAMTILAANVGRSSLVFIDGDHAETAVRREAETLWEAYPTLPILFHDTFVDPETNVPANGPGLAIRDLVRCERHRWTVLGTGLGRPGMTLIVPRSVPEPSDDILRR